MATEQSSAASILDETYFNQSLALIRDSQVVQPVDLQALEGIREELSQNFWNAQMFRSEWEMRNSVLNDTKFPTADAKFWQAVREQNVHFQELVLLCYEVRKSLQEMKIEEAELAKLEEQLTQEEEGTPDYTILEAEAEIKRIEIEKRKFLLLGMQKTAKDRIREIVTWHKIMQELIPQMKYSTTSYEEHQPESYYLRFQKQVENMNKTGWQGANVGEVNNLLGLWDMAQKAVRPSLPESKEPPSLEKPKLDW